jgi:hypothetical protein
MVATSEALFPATASRVRSSSAVARSMRGRLRWWCSRHEELRQLVAVPYVNRTLTSFDTPGSSMVTP